MLKETALTSIQLLQDLAPEEADNFVVAMRDSAAELIAKQQQRSARHLLAPLELPDPLPKPQTRAFPSSRKRAMTGAEAAQQQR